MKILVLGGTRFFGKLLVEKLIKEGKDITILTRGQTSDQFGDHVNRIQCLRSDDRMMRSCLKGKQFDVVYDQICFSPDDAAVSCDIFSQGDVGKYIFTSSMYVYEGQEGPLKESDFNPNDYEVKMGSREIFSYEDGKRMAEVYFARKADFPVVSVRFPIVMGRNDYTGRFAHYISRILSDKNIYLPQPQGRMSFINADDAANFLFWLKDRDLKGPINAAAEERFNTSELVNKFSGVLGKKAKIVDDRGKSDESSYPYYRENNMMMDVSKARSLGYQFSFFDSWFAEEVEAVEKILSARNYK